MHKKRNYIMMLGVVVALFCMNVKLASAQNYVNPTTKIEQDIQVFKNTGLLYSLNLQLNEAQVNPALWHALPYDSKQGVAATLAKACKLSGDSGWIQILDYRTKKRLAKYGAFGFKLYD